MPKMVVRIKPAGSFLPGMRNFAITPATNPMTIVQMMLMRHPPQNRQAASLYTSTRFTCCGKADQRVAHPQRSALRMLRQRRFQGGLERSDLPLADREAVKEA